MVLISFIILKVPYILLLCTIPHDDLPNFQIQITCINYEHHMSQVQNAASLVNQDKYKKYILKAIFQYLDIYKIL